MYFGCDNDACVCVVLYKTDKFWKLRGANLILIYNKKWIFIDVFFVDQRLKMSKMCMFLFLKKQDTFFDIRAIHFKLIAIYSRELTFFFV